MLRHHHFEQLAVEPLGPRLDLAQIEPRLDVEIIGAGAVLKVEVDQAGGAFAARAAVQQQHRGLHRERGHAGAANGGQEGENLRFRRLGADRRLGDARAGAHQFDRRHRLDQKISNARLHEAARHGAVEACRDRDHRRPAADPQHQTLQRRQLGFVGSVNVSDHHGGARDVEIAMLGEPAFDDIEADLGAH